VSPNPIDTPAPYNFSYADGTSSTSISEETPLSENSSDPGAFGLGHLDHICSAFADFYNESRPHQRKDNRPLTGDWSVVDEPLSKKEQIVCQTRLGGVLKHYERLAA